ncbi:hypothetical protein SAMN06265795_104265 [Noviherbaspirillum humi]|uniref:SnoaL-like domain-containing protein n=1 Tax=Noviherbaspirillum humi TaxID=1688639 RepID=A0A239G5T8_9BURK|nr:nuclear transport factor 2 family protein [Noviherbaspirillum humi]SNS64509.1 hypothetical protein SAMN06265795_104265 [Noviherbaspirillum humi]
MYAYEMCRKYQEALNLRDLPAIAALFKPDALIKAPLSGTMGVIPFHERLFAHGRYAIARLENVFDGMTKTRSIALQFTYTWVLSGGHTIVLDGMTIFEIDDAERKFQKVTFIYDPTELVAHIRREGMAEALVLG